MSFAYFPALAAAFLGTALLSGSGNAPILGTANPDPVNPQQRSKKYTGRVGDTEVPDYLRLEHSWNRGPQCGPNCLYVLARIKGLSIALGEGIEVSTCHMRAPCAHVVQVER